MLSGDSLYALAWLLEFRHFVCVIYTVLEHAFFSSEAQVLCMLIVAGNILNSNHYRFSYFFQICNNIKGSYHCSCAAGYMRDQSDPSKCLVRPSYPKPFMLFSNG